MFWLSIAATYFHNRFIHSTLAKALVINTKSTFAFMKYDVVAIRKTACRHRTSRFVWCEMRSNQQKTRRWMLVWKREGPLSSLEICSNLGPHTERSSSAIKNCTDWWYYHPTTTYLCWCLAIHFLCIPSFNQYKLPLNDWREVWVLPSLDLLLLLFFFIRNYNSKWMEAHWD